MNSLPEAAPRIFHINRDTTFGTSSDNYMVRAARARPADVVETDLRACEKVAKEKTEGIRKAANALMWVPGIGGGIAGAVTGTEARSELIRYFTLCMEPRGYTVEPWKPDTK